MRKWNLCEEYVKQKNIFFKINILCLCFLLFSNKKLKESIFPISCLDKETGKNYSCTIYISKVWLGFSRIWFLKNFNKVFNQVLYYTSLENLNNDYSNTNYSNNIYLNNKYSSNNYSNNNYSNDKYFNNNYSNNTYSNNKFSKLI